MSVYGKNQRIWPKCRLLSPLVFGYVQCCVCFFFYFLLVFSFWFCRSETTENYVYDGHYMNARACVCVCIIPSTPFYILHNILRTTKFVNAICVVCQRNAPKIYSHFTYRQHCSTIAHNNRKLCTFRGGLHMDHKHNTGQYPAIEVGGILRQVDRQLLLRLVHLCFGLFLFLFLYC